MSKFILIILCSFLCLASHAETSDWTTADTERQVAITTLLLVDQSQTIYISKHPNNFHETNIFLGEHPKQHKVYQYFTGWILTSALVSYALPTEKRKIWQSIFIGFEGAVTVNNLRLGVGFNF